MNNRAIGSFEDLLDLCIENEADRQDLVSEHADRINLTENEKLILLRGNLKFWKIRGE